MRKLAFVVGFMLFAADVQAARALSFFPVRIGATLVSVSPLLGMYYGNGRSTAVADVNALDAWQGKGNAVLNLFTSWDPAAQRNLFALAGPQRLVQRQGAHDHVGAVHQRRGGPADIEAQIAAGAFDATSRLGRRALSSGSPAPTVCTGAGMTAERTCDWLTR